MTRVEDLSSAPPTDIFAPLREAMGALGQLIEMMEADPTNCRFYSGAMGVVVGEANLNPTLQPYIKL